MPLTPSTRALQVFCVLWMIDAALPFIDSVLGLFQGGGRAGPYDARPVTLPDVVVRLPTIMITAASLICRTTPSHLLVTLCVAHIASLCSLIYWMPGVWDHMYWVGLTELAFVCCAIESALDVERLMPRFLRITRAQFTCLYAFAAFWKVNKSFLDPHTSCGTYLFSELLGAVLPKEFQAALSTPVTLLLLAVPLATFVGEAAIALGLALAPTLGVGLACGLHISVLFLTLNYAGGFSSACICLLVVFLPNAAASAVDEIFSSNGSAARIGYSAVAAAALAVAYSIHGKIETTLPICICLVALYVRGVVMTRNNDKYCPLENRPLSLANIPCGYLYCSLLCLTTMYGALTPIIGVMNMGSCTMYANLQHYGGSNHLFVPVGILQDVFHDEDLAHSSSWLADAFGGGLVRVEWTDAPVLIALNPSDLSASATPYTLSLLRSIGASGVYNSMYLSRVLFQAGQLLLEDEETIERSVTGSLQYPYVVSVFELRRMVELARSYSRPFRLIFTRVPRRYRTAEEWAAFAGVAIHVQHGHAGEPTCTMMYGNESVENAPLMCGAAETRLTKPPPYWLKKLLLQYPVPLVPGQGGGIHCGA